MFHEKKICKISHFTNNLAFRGLISGRRWPLCYCRFHDTSTQICNKDLTVYHASEYIQSCQCLANQITTWSTSSPPTNPVYNLHLPSPSESGQQRISEGLLSTYGTSLLQMWTRLKSLTCFITGLTHCFCPSLWVQPYCRRQFPHSCHSSCRLLCTTTSERQSSHLHCCCSFSTSICSTFIYSG